jgi:hypothetical protein
MEQYDKNSIAIEKAFHDRRHCGKTIQNLIRESKVTAPGVSDTTVRMVASPNSIGEPNLAGQEPPDLKQFLLSKIKIS